MEGAGAAGAPKSYAELLETASGRQRAFLTMFQAMGLGEHTGVVEALLLKLANNLRFWGSRDDIIRRFGAAALDLAWVAAGRYEGFWELGLKPWDMAAGLLIVREAGGHAFDKLRLPRTEVSVERQHVRTLFEFRETPPRRRHVDDEVGVPFANAGDDVGVDLPLPRGRALGVAGVKVHGGNPD